MERKVSKYNLSEDVANELDELMKKALQICQIHKIPFFTTVASANNEENTEYKSYVYSSTANFVNLTDDRIRKHMLIANGYEVIPPREVVSVDVGDLI